MMDIHHDDKGDAVLLSKIETLLKTGGHKKKKNQGLGETTITEETATSAFTSDEVTLVALLLLCRVTQNQDYCYFWQEYGVEVLVPFCQQWLLAPQQSPQPQPQRQVLALRWICVWTSRLVAASRDDQQIERHNYDAQHELLNSILQSLSALLWDYVVSCSSSLDACNDDDLGRDQVLAITEAMECLLFVAKHSNIDNDGDDLEVSTATLAKTMICHRRRLHALWNFACRADLTTTTTKEQSPLPPPSSTPPSPDSILQETLAQLLLQVQPTEEYGDASSSQLGKRYETCLQSLFLEQGKKFIHDNPIDLGGTYDQHDTDKATADTSLSCCWANILTHWWDPSKQEPSSSLSSSKNNNKKEKERRREWTIVFLQLLIEACQSSRTTTKTKNNQPSAWEKFWSFSSRWSCWTRLTTTCFSSDDDILRSLAWTATAQVILSTSWPKILQLLLSSSTTTMKSTSSGLKTAATTTKTTSSSTWIPTVARFAVGEAKIQLGWLVSTTEPSLSENCKILIQATCRVNCQCIDLIGELTSESDEDGDVFDSRVLPAASLQSLNRSLEEGLDTAVQYLNLSEQRCIEVDTAVISAFGCLLTEFDVFESSNRPQTKMAYDVSNDNLKSDHEQEENVSLNALRAAIKVCPSACRRELLLGLVTVLASAEGDDSRVKLLKEAKLMEDDTLELLHSCWNDDAGDNDPTICTACDMVEVLLDVNPILEISNLQSVIVKWVQRALGQPLRKAALESSVACYVRLQGQTPPEEPDATIIRKATEVLASS